MTVFNVSGSVSSCQKAEEVNVAQDNDLMYGNGAWGRWTAVTVQCPESRTTCSEVVSHHAYPE